MKSPSLFLLFGVIFAYIAAFSTRFFFDLDPFWGVIVFAFIGVSSILISRRIAWRVNETQALQKRCSAHSDNRPPFLLLRSFSRTGLAFRPDRYRDNFIAPGESYLNDIGAILEEEGPLIAIGSPDDTIGIPSDQRLLYFQSSESGWMEMFRLASEAARSVIVIPGNTPGALREVRDLVASGAISKVIVFMPPTPSGFKQKWLVEYSDTHTIAALWREVQRQWKNISVALPDYDKAGMVFALTSSGKPHRKVSLEGKVEYPDLTPVRQLSRVTGGSTAPISILAPKLERLEAPRKRPSLVFEILRLVGLGY